MKKTRNLLVLILFLFACLLCIPTVSARFNAVDVYGTYNEETGLTTYEGNVTVVTNTNFAIDSDEKFKEALATGAKRAEAASFGAMEALDTLDAPLCGTLKLNQGQVNRDAVVLEAQSEEEPPAVYAVGTKKTVKVITGIDESGESVIEDQQVICQAVGQHCTIWYPEDSGKTTEDGDKLAASFDGFHEKMLQAFGDPAPIDVDKDGRVAVMVTPLFSDYAGYFWAEDLKGEDSPTGNKMDMVNLNLRYANEENKDSLFNTLCHEYQHLINFAVVGENSEGWLNETFSQNAPEVCGITNRAEDTNTMYLEEYIKATGRSIPFIFEGFYVPQVGAGDAESFIVYAQWYLFGRYLAAQSEGFSGGGDGIYRAVLDYEAEDQKHSCTRESLTKVLEEKGILKSQGQPQSFEDFVGNFNTALVLQEAEGLFSFKGRSVTDFEYPLNQSALPTELWGGGAAAVAVNSNEPRTAQSFTPNGADAAMRFAGISKNRPSPVAADQANNAFLTIGTKVTLSSPDGDVSIRYRLATDLSKVYDYKEPLTITERTEIFAVAVDADGNESPGVVFNFDAEPELVTASPESGHLNKEGSEITLSCATQGAEIRYTTDGSDPYIRIADEHKIVSNGTVYDPKTPIVLEKNTTLRAIAYLPKQLDTTFVSGVTSWEYCIDPIIRDRYEPNDALDEATAISFPTRFDALISTEEDVDYYGFTLEAPRSLNLRLTTAEKGLKYDIILADSTGKTLKKGIGEGDQAITTKATPAGRYILRIESSSGASDTKPYTLSLEKRAEKNDAVDLSEMNMLMAYVDVNTKNETNYVQENGLSLGGNTSMATHYFSVDGPVSESVQPYDDTINGDTAAFNKSAPIYKLRQALYLPDNTSADAIQTLKSCILSYGAVASNFRVYQTAYDDMNTNYYAAADYRYTSPDDGGHAITVVGWDDNYDKENFTGSAAMAKHYGYDTFDYQKPKNNGAFICKNSWGTVEGAGKEGYFYISYEDATFMNSYPTLFLADEQPGMYETQYYNDQFGANAFYKSPQSQQMGQVFKTGNTGEVLEAVSFQAPQADCTYDIYLRIGDAKETKHLMQVTKKYGGYYTERLDTPITLPANTTFEIILRGESTTPGGGTCIGISMPESQYKNELEEHLGISFYYEQDGTVTDMGADPYRYYVSIRALTNGKNGGSQLFSAAADAVTAEEAEARRTLRQTCEDSQAKGGGLSGNVVLMEKEDTQVSASGLNETVAMASLDTAAPDMVLPAAFDLREIDAVTPVKDQGRLGSCWTFSSIASMESTLLRSGLNAYDYPTGIALESSTAEITLGEGEQTLSLIAQVLGADNPTTKRVNWSFSGDLDSVEILTNAGFSGEATPLIRAKAAGTLVLTASNDGNINQTASCTLTITDPKNPAGDADSGTTSSASNIQTGIAGGSGMAIAILLCLVAGMLIVSRKNEN